MPACPLRSHFQAGTWTIRFPSRSNTASTPRPTMSVALEAALRERLPQGPRFTVVGDGIIRVESG